VSAAVPGGTGLGRPSPEHVAVALLALAEGLSLHVLSHNLPVASAVAALDAQLDLVLGMPDGG
jgi:hypothetical protein